MLLRFNTLLLIGFEYWH